MEKTANEIDKWKVLRNDLNANYAHSDKWNYAVNIFDKRIDDKYLKPVSWLIKNLPKKGEGFPIVTIQCALIETFAAFKEGLIYNHNKPGIGGLIYEYRDSSELFVRFLNTEQIFNGLFYSVDKLGNKQNNIPFSATQFYSQVRCGLMHETRTKGKWVINASKEDNLSDLVFIKQRAKGYIIYRDRFQLALNSYFESYKSDLKNTSDTFNSLRRLFARKLDHLYDFKDNSEWWTP